MTGSKRAPWHIGAVLLAVALGFWAGTRKARAAGSSPNVSYNATYVVTELAYFDPAKGIIGFATVTAAGGGLLVLPSSLPSNAQILGESAAQTGPANGVWTSGGGGGGQLGQDACAWSATQFAVSGTTSGSGGGPFTTVVDRPGLLGLKNVTAVTGFQVAKKSESIQVFFSAGS